MVVIVNIGDDYLHSVVHRLARLAILIPYVLSSFVSNVPAPSCGCRGGSWLSGTWTIAIWSSIVCTTVIFLAPCDIVDCLRRQLCGLAERYPDFFEQPLKYFPLYFVRLNTTILDENWGGEWDCNELRLMSVRFCLWDSSSKLQQTPEGGPLLYTHAGQAAPLDLGKFECRALPVYPLDW